jgi:hypothetical protein
MCNALGLKSAQGVLLTTSIYWGMDEQTRAWCKRLAAIPGEKASHHPTRSSLGEEMVAGARLTRGV